MKIRSSFIEDIDKFIYSFGAVFKNVENSPDLYEFKGEDKKLQQQIEELQKKYCEILKIFNNISSSTA